MKFFQFFFKDTTSPVELCSLPVPRSGNLSLGSDLSPESPGTKFAVSFWQLQNCLGWGWIFWDVSFEIVIIGWVLRHAVPYVLLFRSQI